MVSGFVKLRRGILEHLESGRITSDEFSAYVLIILKADHRTGWWKGSGESLAYRLHWCQRKGQKILADLIVKGYLTSYRPNRGRGVYPIQVNRYFDKVHQDAPSRKKGAPGCTLVPNKVHQDATSQEVIQEINIQEGAKPRMSPKAIESYFKRHPKSRIGANQ